MPARRVSTEPAAIDRARLARIALAAQGLHREAAFGRGSRGALKTIEHLGYVQIDTISVVARAHHHTMFTRVPDFAPEMLDRLQARGRIFEYWYHAAAYLPMRDYRFQLPRMLGIRNGTNPHWFPKRDRKLEGEILARISAEGALTSRDFEDSEPRSAAGWWNWKPAKRSIEALFMDGTLMSPGRDGFAKRYDLRARVLPADVDTSVPDTDEFAAYLIDSHLRAHGFAAETEFSYLRRGTELRTAIRTRLSADLASGVLTRVRIRENDALVLIRTELLDSRPKVAPLLRLLSPFDNSLIQRERAVRVHDYDYQIECYTKAEKRQFGYFCLPIQFGERFVGRADCKADRKRGVLRVQELFIERDDLALDAFAAMLAPALHAFATFNDCASVELERVSPRGAQALLTRALRAQPNAVPTAAAG